MNHAADPEQVRESARRILSRPEFGDHRSLVDRMIDGVIEWIADLFGGLTGGLGSGTGLLGAVIQVVVVVGAFVALVLIGRALIRVARSRRRLPADDGPVVVFGKSVDPSELMAEAEQAEADGRWTQAALARYRHLVATLVMGGVLAGVPGRTTGEYRTEYRAARPPTAPEFDAATRSFELAFYGSVPLSQIDAEEMQRLTSGMLADRIDPSSVVGAR